MDYGPPPPNCRQPKKTNKLDSIKLKVCVTKETVYRGKGQPTEEETFPGRSFDKTLISRTFKEPNQQHNNKNITREPNNLGKMTQIDIPPPKKKI